MPLAEILEPATPAPKFAKGASYFLMAGVLSPVVIFVLLAKGKPLNFEDPVGALAMVVGIIVAVCGCISLFIGLVLKAGMPSRRPTGADGGGYFFGGGSDGAGYSGGHDSHSHGSHGGHSDSGGGHSCGGHGCGGHGCGGH